MPNFVSIG